MREIMPTLDQDARRHKNWGSNTNKVNSYV